MAIVAYLTHPLGEQDQGDPSQRGDNVANAMQWFKFLVMTTRWVVTCPWFVYMAAIDDVFHRPRAMRDQVELIGRSDLVVMVGGRISGHMQIEANYATNKIGIPIPSLDLTHLGVRPPWDLSDRIGKEIVRLAKTIGI